MVRGLGFAPVREPPREVGTAPRTLRTKKVTTFGFPGIRWLESPYARNSIGNVLRMDCVVRPMLRRPDRLQIVAKLEDFAYRYESSENALI